jgi:hypothetical protein
MDELTKHKVTKMVAEFCDGRVPPDVRDQIKLLYKIRGNDVNIIESRPHWQDNNIWTEMPIAKIRYLPKKMLWQLLWIKANGKWQKYPELEPCKDLKKVINEIDKDPHYAFWG